MPMGPGDIIRWAGFRWVASRGDLSVQIHFLIHHTIIFCSLEIYSGAGFCWVVSRGDLGVGKLINQFASCQYCGR